MIAHHIVAQVSFVRVISWSSHDERISSTSSPPFLSISSSSHSSSISCTSSCTSSTTLRAVVTLRTSLERRWTPLTIPASSHVEDAYSSSYSDLNVDETWSTQEWKSDELMEVRTGRPVLFTQHTDIFIVENDKMNSYTEAESEMS